MMEPQELSLVKASPMPVAALPDRPNVAGMLQAVVERGVTSENVSALEALVKLYEHTRALEAEGEFARAFAALQSELPAVKATVPVPAKDGSVRYRFAPLERIMQQVKPVILRHGFSLSFSEKSDGGRKVIVVTLTHSGGHSRTSEFSARVSAPYGANETQADGATTTYAKRFALCNILNIVIEHLDSDANLEGEFISDDQAKELERRVMETGSDTASFLKFAGAASFKEIRAGKYAVLDKNLRRKENTNKS